MSIMLTQRIAIDLGTANSVVWLAGPSHSYHSPFQYYSYTAHGASLGGLRSY
jgi:hypothetical protein